MFILKFGMPQVFQVIQPLNPWKFVLPVENLFALMIAINRGLSDFNFFKLTASILMR